MKSNASVFLRLQFLFTFLCWVLPHAALRIPAAIVRARIRGLPLGPSIWNAFAGALMANAPPHQLQAIMPSTIETYNAWISSHGTRRAVDILPADRSTRLLWMGPRKANKVVLFFHGGGYVMPLSEGHLDWMAHIRKEAGHAGIELSVCMLEYDLVPANPYPRQMMQGIFALKHLFALGYKPSDVVFGGDSAGGHLSLCLLSHLHRHRYFEGEADYTIDLQGPVKGCFLVSPLSSFDFNTPSYQRWLSADVLSRRVVDEWGVYLVKDSPWQEEIAAGSGWGMALDVPEGWWENLEVVDRILVTGGYEEVFSDHIQRLGDLLKRKIKGTVTLYMANEAHDGPLMDFAAGRTPSRTTKAITNFVVACFKE
ncbi:alpha/beta-hydrolase [Aspergillus steynii IBT 23096]|uniref:Alpha/beta-hydrolase n=1 Tax=Aspergillus steynii IBT 23096 TaxID=1392250 RepID=A0A2I2GNS6_9EURO|nr:alpha/beta-hydrolase [Aspergillus steynii IBT 23096]PLB54516.1 alpha/beta-hydrolase [Aspergillus steynii IBT 23096]